MFRLRKIADNNWSLTHPDGFWVGPGLGRFYSVADALNWLYSQRR